MDFGNTEKKIEKVKGMKGHEEDIIYLDEE